MVLINLMSRHNGVVEDYKQKTSNFDFKSVLDVFFIMEVVKRYSDLIA